MGGESSSVNTGLFILDVSKNYLSIGIYYPDEPDWDFVNLFLSKNMSNNAVAPLPMRQGRGGSSLCTLKRLNRSQTWGNRLYCIAGATDAKNWLKGTLI